MHGKDSGASSAPPKPVPTVETTRLNESPELRERFRVQQADSLTRINSIGAPFGLLLVLYLTFLSDPVSYPAYAHAMFLGRMYLIVVAALVGILSFIPPARKFGVPISFLAFLGASLSMAHITGVMNNENADVTAWLLVNIIFCGVYPLPVWYSLAVVVLSFGYYVFIFLSSGFMPDLGFRMTLINVGIASFLTLAFKIGIERIRKREFYFRAGLEQANAEIADLNEKLKDENVRLSHELEIAAHIQSIVLPQEKDYRAFRDLEISCQMIPAAEVGGDFYDTIHFGPEGFLSIGDVTDHGLHSGLIMMMVHTALRALAKVEQDDIQRIYRVINRLLYDFRVKTLDHRIMSLLIIKYLGEGRFVMTGQHESLLILRSDGTVQDIDSLEYGMYAGLDANVAPYLKLYSFRLDLDDVLILYTDGITEAVDTQERQFGRQGIIDAAVPVRGSSAAAIQAAVMDACQAHIGAARRYDDLSIVVVKKLADRGWDGQLHGTVRLGDRIDFTEDVDTAFTVRFLPLDMFDDWQRGGALSDFAAHYFGHNFPRDEQFSLLSTVINELVENAVKFTANNSLPVELTLKKARDRMLVQAANTIPVNRCQPFMAVCQELFEKDLDDLYMERLKQDQENRSASGLGLLLIKKDYSSRLSFEFRFDEDNNVRVTAIAELVFSGEEAGIDGR
jgi:serine phosphatase RsbU (regulator of sigma subunit)